MAQLRAENLEVSIVGDIDASEVEEQVRVDFTCVGANKAALCNRRASWRQLVFCPINAIYISRICC